LGGREEVKGNEKIFSFFWGDDGRKRGGERAIINFGGDGGEAKKEEGGEISTSFLGQSC